MFNALLFETIFYFHFSISLYAKEANTKIPEITSEQVSFDNRVRQFGTPDQIFNYFSSIQLVNKFGKNYEHIAWLWHKIVVTNYILLAVIPSIPIVKDFWKNENTTISICFLTTGNKTQSTYLQKFTLSLHFRAILILESQSWSWKMHLQKTGHINQK